MKKFLILLTFSVLVIGCVPSNSGDIATPELHPTEQALAPADPSLITTATPSPLRERVTPNPTGQVLDHTNWRLDHTVIDGEIRELKYYERLRLSFGQGGMRFDDSCNSGSYGNSNGLPIYVAAEDGTFIFPFQDWDEENVMTILSTALACTYIDEATGEEHLIDIDVIIPYGKIGTYELSADELRLYYPDHKYDVLVFKRYTFPPTTTPIKIPETTLTAEAKWIATMNALPTLTPSRTPIPPTAYPGQPPTATPVPTSMFYP